MTAPLDADPRRRAELATSLDRLNKRIANACAAAGRDVSEVTLIAVTKTYPAVDVAILSDLGCEHFGESRDQEAKVKVQEVATLANAARTWHFVGRLQTNKCRSVASYADVVHSVDRLDIADALAKGVQRAGRGPVGVFVQLSLDGDPARGGVPLADASRFADQVAARDGLKLAGVMAVAPIGADLDVAFDAVATSSADLQRTHPDARSISAGMSEDFESALRHGATHIRVGSALLGRRPPVFS